MVWYGFSLVNRLRAYLSTSTACLERWGPATKAWKSRAAVPLWQSLFTYLSLDGCVPDLTELWRLKLCVQYARWRPGCVWLKVQRGCGNDGTTGAEKHGRPKCLCSFFCCVFLRRSPRSFSHHRAFCDTSPPGMVRACEEQLTHGIPHGDRWPSSLCFASLMRVIDSGCASISPRFSYRAGFWILAARQDSSVYFTQFLPVCCTHAGQTVPLPCRQRGHLFPYADA